MVLDEDELNTPDLEHYFGCFTIHCNDVKSLSLNIFVTFM